MAVLTNVPLDFSSHPFYIRLANDGRAGTECLSKINSFTPVAESLADLTIAGPFRNYTLHNRGHAKKLIHLMQYIMPSEVIQSLDSLECLLLVYAAHLHDLGLAITSHERSEIVSSAAFQDHIREWPEIWSRLTHARESLADFGKSSQDNDEARRFLLETQIFQMQEAAICSLMRPRHATDERYRSLISQLSTASGRNDLFEYEGVSFADALVQVCVSHNQDAALLSEVYTPYNERFPRCRVFSGQKVNIQFCAAILRLADILDFDRERTPRILFDSLNIGDSLLPDSDVSLLEWHKHMSIHSLDIGTDEIIVYAECTHPVIEKTIRDFCIIIERELRDCQAVLRHNSREIQDKYYINLPINVRPQIISHGYIYKDISLQMNQAAITSLLMGDRLYSEPFAAIRELIQNAIDAIAARKLFEDSKGFTPNISVSSHIDEHGYCWLEVSDNGIGMDEHVIGEYFLKLGNTYYDSPEFERQARMAGKDSQFVPIARFGIGIVSVFMIGDILEIETRRFKSPRGDEKGRVVRIERMGGLAFVTENNSLDFGSTVRLRLKPDSKIQRDIFFGGLLHYLHEIIIRPSFDIHVQLGGNKLLLSQRPYISINEEAGNHLLNKGLEVFIVEVGRWSKRLSGRIIILLYRTEDGKLTHRLHDKNIVLDASHGSNDSARINPYRIFQNYDGNRVVVNGFRMSLKKLGRVAGGSKKKLPAIFDISILGDRDVIYDVSRGRIFGNGATLIKNELRHCLLSGLSELGILDQMADDTRNLTEITLTGLINDEHVSAIPFDVILGEDILAKVEQLLPKSVWPRMIHKSIAKSLNISNGLAYKAISILVDSGRVTNFNQSGNNDDG